MSTTLLLSAKILGKRKTRKRSNWANNERIKLFIGMWKHSATTPPEFKNIKNSDSSFFKILYCGKCRRKLNSFLKSNLATALFAFQGLLDLNMSF